MTNTSAAATRTQAVSPALIGRRVHAPSWPALSAFAFTSSAEIGVRRLDVLLAGADPDHALERLDEDLPVADLARARRRDDRLDRRARRTARRPRCRSAPSRRTRRRASCPRYCSTVSCSPPCPCTRESEMPVTPARKSAAFTSASFSGRMMVVMSFMALSPRLGLEARFCTIMQGPRRSALVRSVREIPPGAVAPYPEADASDESAEGRHARPPAADPAGRGPAPPRALRPALLREPLLPVLRRARQGPLEGRVPRARRLRQPLRARRRGRRRPRRRRALGARSSAPTRAEVAFTVADAQQGKGLGSLLFRRLATLARARGIDDVRRGGPAEQREDAARVRAVRASRRPRGASPRR